jgi:hypothetical protein
MENGYVRVPVAVILSFVNGRKAPGADMTWLNKLHWVKKLIAQRFAHLKGRSVDDFPPNSWCKVPDFYINPAT